MKRIAIIAMASALLCAPAMSQTNPGSSPLRGAKGGTNNAFMQFTGPATSIKTYALPNASDTIATLAAAQTLTNKTFDCANNVCTVRIANDVTGIASGCITFLVTPSSANLRGCLTDEVGTGAFYTVGGALGTPASGTATNITGLPLSGLVPQAAWSFVVNNTSGSAAPTAVDIAALTTKVSPAAGDYVLLSDQAASGALKKASVSSVSSAGSVSSIAGNTGACTLGGGLENNVNDIRLRAPTVQVLTSGTGATYTTASGVRYIRVKGCGGGGGGAGSGTGVSGGNGGDGGTTSFSASTMSATGGGGGNATSGNGVAGGTGTNGQINYEGASGGPLHTGVAGNFSPRVSGGASPLFGGGGSTTPPTNSGAGGASGQFSGAGSTGGGGSAGGCFERIISSPSATYTYTIGAGGTAGTAGTSGSAGIAGAAGKIVVEEF